MIPMPHSLHGGGILAASASGKTRSVLDVLRQVDKSNKEIDVVGIASVEADEFHSLCDLSIKIVSAPARGLSALADLEEFVIAELMDALVVAAGTLLGYSEASWKLGHEDLGPATGPYDFRPGGGSP
jgi:D-arabinose 5-phosphate isomerase GutQ